MTFRIASRTSLFVVFFLAGFSVVVAACGDDGAAGAPANGGGDKATAGAADKPSDGEGGTGEGVAGSASSPGGVGTGGATTEPGSGGVATGESGAAGETSSGGEPAVGGANSGDASCTNCVTEGDTTYIWDAAGATFNAQDGSAGYLGYTNDFLHSVNLGVSGLGTFDPCAAMAYSKNGAGYSSSYSPSTCKVTVTKMPAASGDHFIGTFSATLYKADHTTFVTLTKGKFDGILP
jgi:hypothetical protein